MKVRGFVVGASMGEGESAEIYDAVRRADARSVVLKVARAAIAADVERRARFVREATLLARVKSPFVRALVAEGTLDDGRPWIALERLEGESLAQLLEREPPLDTARLLRIADEVLQGLVAAHAVGVVHRDLSPENVFLSRTPDGATRVKLIDFGVAKDVAASSTARGTFMGSYLYAAPEQASDSARVSPTADLYALGIIMLAALAGGSPWGPLRGPALLSAKRTHDPPSLAELMAGEPPRALARFIAKACALDPAKRFGTAADALDQLRRFAPRITFGRVEPRLDFGATTTIDRPAKRRRG